MSAAVCAAAARKMAIVEAMTPAQRAKVWDMGLNHISKKFPALSGTDAAEVLV